MAHMVESMAYRGETPWHGLGFKLPAEVDTDGMLVAAGLNWAVNREPVYCLDGEGRLLDVPGTFALVRSDNGRVLASCGKVYKPTQNRDAFEFFRRFVEAGEATMETGGSLDDGRFIWGLANLNAGFKLANGDESKGYLLVGNPHKPGQSLVVKHTMIRVVCMNTLTSALASGGSEFRMRHSREFDATMRDEAARVLGLAREQTTAWADQARALESVILAYEDAVKIYGGVYQPERKPGEPYNRAMMGVLNSYLGAPGATPGNGWGVLNGVTHFEDHVHGRSASTRLKSAWMGAGEKNKQAVLGALLVGAGI